VGLERFDGYFKIEGMRYLASVGWVELRETHLLLVSRSLSEAHSLIHKSQWYL